jgi:hypothetical protein
MEHEKEMEILPKILKKVWHNAICSEFFNSSGDDAVKAAIIPVTVVPMFEPRVNGYTRSIVMIPRPTKGVKVEVKIELL